MPDQLIEFRISSDGSGLPAGISLREALGEVPKEVIGAEGPDRLYGLEDALRVSGSYRLMTLDSPRAMEIFWHSASHLMAQAVMELFPGVKLGIGPAIRNGFYYDFDFPTPVSADDLPKIEEVMRRNAAANLPITRRELSAAEALEYFKQRGETYKVELIEDLTDPISVYTQGDFIDLCRGPHLPSTGYLKHFALTAVTGAYWRGDERNPMLQRIYGVAYPNDALLKDHMHRLEEAKKRDHRLLGKELDLFSMLPEAPGAPFWHPKGVILVQEVLRFMRELLARRGYGEVMTPLIMSRDLWERSGHWDHYHNNMYFTAQEDRDYAVKPMNCPGAVLMFKSRQWSYRDLPQRWAEFGIVHRYEKSGVLHGLFRVRHITQDDAHVFCTLDQLVDEISRLIDLVFEVFAAFGIGDISLELSTRPKDRIGADELWDKAEAALKDALEKRGQAFELNPGEGAFYGPKIDFHVRDSLGRSWQLSTIQVDFNFPERFELEYIGPDNQPHRPVMLHRAILGALERFIGILIEHYAGDFPLWLAPEQAVILPITDAQIHTAGKIAQEFERAGIRCRIDDRSEKIGKKIRDSENGKIPYMLVIGPREADSGQISLRRRKEGDVGVMSVGEVKQRLLAEIESHGVEESV